MTLTRAIATRDGGRQVECTPEECVIIEAEWKKNAEESEIEQKEEAYQKKLANEGMNTLCDTLPEAQAMALKNMLGM